jgi:diguanylate cyclase (GGDEF)-like protein
MSPNRHYRQHVAGEKGARTLDAPLRARRDQILSEMSARETPRVALLFAFLMVAFDVGTALTGTHEPGFYYLADAIQGCAFVLVAYLIWSGIAPSRIAPSVFAAAIVVSNSALSVQYAIDPVSNTLGIVMICLVASGALILMWRPFLISAAIMVVVTTATLLMTMHDHATGWVLTAYLALGVSAVLLYGRSRSAVALAIASMTIEDIATRDPLTGLLNRRGLTLSSTPVAAIAYRDREPLFAIFIDIVGLKRVNDTFGHSIGDLVIQRSAQAVKAISRDSDVVTRWGGDEFLVIGIGPEPHEDVYLERIRGALDLSGLEGKWNGDLSIGTAADHGGNIEAIIESADAAMYIARSALRSRQTYGGR